MKRLFVLVVSILSTVSLFAQEPSREEVLELTTKVNAWFMNHYDPAATWIGGGKVRTTNLWTRAVYHEGLCALYEIDPQKVYYDYNLRMAEGNHWSPRYGVTTRDADNYACVQAYIDIYEASRSARINRPLPDSVLNQSKKIFDDICSENHLPVLTARGETAGKAAWWWIDALQMGMPAMAKLGRLTGDHKYWDQLWLMYEYTRNQQDGGLWNAAEGLWWRDRDFNPPYTTPNGRQCYWSRGNGWVVAALLRTMNEIGPSAPHYDQYMSDFKAMCEALIPLQREDGFWNCDLGDPDNFGGPETTGTALFLYGMAWGVRNGHLDAATYRPVIDKAWKAIASVVRPDGWVGMIQGTGKEPKDSQPVNMTRQLDFEDFGIGCWLLGATEYYKLLALTASSAQQGEGIGWPRVRQEAKPGVRWWWMGSAVDSANLTRNLEAYAKAGIGAVEITPIYGVVGNEKNDIDFLSPRWMQMLSHTINEGKRLGIQVDMNCGTGWPFGGPTVSIDDAATKAVFTEKGVEIGKTRQQVKRAAPGGEGFVVDHMNRDAIMRYLKRFDDAFAQSGAPLPHSFFNDSYEVYNADWTAALPDTFALMHGYRIEERLDALTNAQHPDHGTVVADYRATVARLVLNSFVHPWVDWCHKYHATVRNQAHGSPANLLDVYAAVDIPEIEGFGLSDFGIQGLRTDTLTRKNDSDLSMLKYPASVAHFYGKPFVSAETFTWLTEHFRTSLSQCKPDFDLMMVAGVNHCFIHGTTYSPAHAQWPGHLFYASIEMNPQNTIWRDAPALFEYMTRVQSWMQYGNPDNELLVYLPVNDIWHEQPGLLLQFDIHSMARKAPRFIHAVTQIYEAGYDMDYCSDKMIEALRVENGVMVSPSGMQYKALVLPEVKHLPAETLACIDALQKQGANIVLINNAASYSHIGGFVSNAKHESMTQQHGLKYIRRSNAQGHHYFISSLQPKGVNDWVELGVSDAQVMRFNPLTGAITQLATRLNASGKTEVFLNLASGESCILQTLKDGVLAASPERAVYDSTGCQPCVSGEIQTLSPTLTKASWSVDLTHATWTLEPLDMTSFEPLAKETLKGLHYLTEFSPKHASASAWKNARGTARYSTKFRFKKGQYRPNLVLDLGDVRESAHVYVNGHDCGVVFCAPFRLQIGQYLKQKGNNEIIIDVTGLAANYVAEMDRQGIEWRIFKNANIANLKGGKVSYYGNWDLMPVGLNSVKLY